MASTISTTNDEELKTAAQNGDIYLLYEVIEKDPYVLEHVDSIPFVETPLHIAASAGHVEFATEIMRLKPSFGRKLNPKGFSPIHVAMQKGQETMVLRFVEIDKDLVRVKGREGLTPLHLASQTGDVDLLAEFLTACPDSIKDVTVRSETALHIAVKSQKYKALQVLVTWLKTTCQLSGAMELEKKILNWKDAAGNTILHVSAALINKDNFQVQALRLLVKAKIELNAKNSADETALDIATASAEINNILVSAGAKHGPDVKKAPTLAATILVWKMTFMDKILIRIIRMRRDISEEQRNAFMVVAALVATAIYQSVLSPPGGVYQANAGDHNNNNNVNSTTSLNSMAAGKSVLSAGDFSTLSISNMLSLLVSTMAILVLLPNGIVDGPLGSTIGFFILSYLTSWAMITPTHHTGRLLKIVIGLCYLILIGICIAVLLIWISRVRFFRRKNQTRNRAGGNVWYLIIRVCWVYH